VLQVTGAAPTLQMDDNRQNDPFLDANATPVRAGHLCANEQTWGGARSSIESWVPARCEVQARYAGGKPGFLVRSDEHAVDNFCRV
jgi:hypothetical protein